MAPQGALYPPAEPEPATDGTNAEAHGVPHSPAAEDATSTIQEPTQPPNNTPAPSSNPPPTTNGDHAPNGTDSTSNTEDSSSATPALTPQTTAQQPLRIEDIDDRFHQLPATNLLAASWAALVRQNEENAADEIERIGRRIPGDAAFQAAMNHYAYIA